MTKTAEKKWTWIIMKRSDADKYRWETVEKFSSEGDMEEALEKYDRDEVQTAAYAWKY